MKYINDKTKAIIETDLAISGGNWRLLEDSVEEVEDSVEEVEDSVEEKPKKTKNRKAQIKKDDE